MNAQQILADHRQANADAVRLIYPSAPSAGRNQIEFQFCLTDDIEVAVHCDYEPGERMTRDDPGCDESITVCAVYLYDTDIYELCTAKQIEAMGDKCMEVIQEQRDEADIDRYESTLEY